MNIEDKIKEYVVQRKSYFNNADTEAHDIAEIVAKEQKYLNRAEVEKILHGKIMYTGNPYGCEEFEEEIFTAICNLAPEIKYLDKKKIHELKILFYQLFTHDWLPEWNDRKANIEKVDKFFNEISNLAIQPIDKNKARDILTKELLSYGFDENKTHGFTDNYTYAEILAGKILTEILTGETGEEGK